jgi:predicted dehydrogenase
VFDSGVVPDDPSTFGEFRLTYRTGDIVSLRVDADEPLQLEMRDFCEAIRSGSIPVSSAELGLEVVRMIEAVDASLADKGARVELTETSDAPNELTESKRARLLHHAPMPD